MGLGGKVRRFFLKLGLCYLPLAGLGLTAINAAQIATGRVVIKVQPDGTISEAEKARGIGEMHGRIRKITPFSAALAGIFLIGAYGAYTSRKRRVVLEEHRGIDRAFDYPGILAAGSTAASLGALAALACHGSHSFVPDALNRDTALAGGLLASIGASCWSAFYLGFDAISKLKSPCLGSIASICRYAFSSPAAREKKSIEIFAAESDTLLAARARVAMNEGRGLDSLYYWNACLQYMRRRPEVEECLATNYVAGLGRRVANAVAIMESKKLLGNDPENLGLLTDREFMMLFSHRQADAKALAEKILSLPKCTDEDRMLQSFVLDALGEAGLADMIRRDVFGRFLKVRGHSKVGGGLLYAKPGLRERLVQESQLLDYLQKYCSRHDFEAARPLGIWDSGSGCHLFETFSDGESLYTLLERTPDFAVLRKAAIAQAVLHGIIPAQGCRELEQDVSSFIERMPWQFGKSSLYDALRSLLQPVWRYQAADCDGHRENRHYNTAGQITVYDLEQRGMAPVSSDYAKVMRQGGMVGSWDEQKDLLVECAEKYNSIASGVRITPSELPGHVLRMSPYKALRFASFVWNNPHRHGTAIKFLENAEKDIELLKDTDELPYSELSCAVRTVREQLIELGGSTQPSSSH
ncbi:MAG: hypothetical protein QXM31_02940 [Candidatus Woesearchaeota archaeon]